MSTTPCLPLTHENLDKFLFLLEPVDDEPLLTALDRAKRGVYRFLRSLETIGAVGKRIIQTESLYIDHGNKVQFRGEGSHPVFEDAAFWEGSLQRLQGQYGRIISIEQIKGSVFAVMSALSHSGCQGKQILEHDELYIAGRYEIRHRGDRCREADLDQVAYWERKYTYFEEQLFDIRQRTRAAPKLLHTSIQRKESPYEGQWLPSYRRGLGWDNAPTQPAGEDLGARIPSSRPESIADFSESRDTLQRVKGYVYEQMRSLQEAGAEGQRILDGDELRIDDNTSVVYRLGQHFFLDGHKILYCGSGGTPPDLEDHTYWERKWQHFRRQGLRIARLREAKAEVYHAMKDLQSCEPAGRHILDKDDLYIAAPFDIRHRRSEDENTDLEDPGYWHEKCQYFKDNYVRLQPAPHPTFAVQGTSHSASSPEQKRSRSSTVPDRPNKRRRASCSGLDKQQTGYPHIHLGQVFEASSHSSAATGEKVGEPVQDQEPTELLAHQEHDPLARSSSTHQRRNKTPQLQRSPSAGAADRLATHDKQAIKRRRAGTDPGHLGESP